MTHVEVIERNGRWHVRLINGHGVATVGIHTAKYKAEAQAEALRGHTTNAHRRAA